MILSQANPIDIIERTLRSVIDEVLSERFGPNWTRDKDAGLGSDWIEGLAKKANEDQRIQAPNVVYDVPLAYAEFRDLGALLEKHRSLFQPIFKDWEITTAHFHAAEKLRNTIQHNRDISPSQQSLLVGIAGEIQDSVNIWRIGAPLRTKRTVLQFRDGITVRDRTDAQIREEAADYVAGWRDRILNAIRAGSLDLGRASNVEDEKFRFSVRVQHLEASIWTQPTWMPMDQVGGASRIAFQAEFKYRPAFRDPNGFLEVLGKPYYVIAFELENRLNVQALERWAAERAGLTPSGSQRFNGELESVDYSLFSGQLRISAQKFVERTRDSGGKLLVIAEPPTELWHAHELLGPERLIGFLVGDITPRAMRHLVQMSSLRRSAL